METLDAASLIPPQVDALSKALQLSVERFRSEPSPENFASIVNSLREFGVTGVDLWKQAVAYTQKNPVRVALYAGVIFYALKGLAGIPTKPAIRDLALH